MPEWSLPTAVAVIVVGGTVGFVSGVFGIGGGFLLVPVLNVFLGIPMPQAVGSTACFTLGPSTTAILVRRPRRALLQLPLIIAGGLAGGTFLGSHLLHRLHLLGRFPWGTAQLPAADVAVLSSYFVLMIVIAGLLLFDSVEVTERRGLQHHLLLPPVAVLPELRPALHSIPWMGWMGVVVGFLSGFLGMSGGLVLIPMLVYLLGMRFRDAATTSLLIVWLVSLQSATMHAFHHHVDLRLVILLLAGGSIGAQLGARLGLRLPRRMLTLGFAAIVLLSATVVFVRLAGLSTP